MNPVIQKVTQRIIKRSVATRKAYLEKIEKARKQGPLRGALSCGNLAHGFAACGKEDKSDLRNMIKANVAIVSAYNDMLSAHHPYETYPQQIKKAINEVGSVAQFAGGVPAMCDGVTQGTAGMELSLMSRDNIAMGAAIALSHNMFDATIMLGICDKIVPGQLLGALSFGHLPTVFVPAGPMPSGLPNKEKARVRQAYAEGKVGREELLDAESESYHSSGTCTFYGTANSNQLVVEIMGLHLPGASFVNPGTPLRDALTKAASVQATRLTDLGDNYMPIGHIVDAKSMVNGLVGLLATGGSTNHTMHLVAVARAAGLIINWDDFSDISSVTPLLTRIYPNGSADINHFTAAGGTGLL
ncbi:MAG: phosphogluconate dehydratase, partial [Arenicella sp.]